MDRAAWLAEKRRNCEIRMDTLFAPDYDAHWDHINPSHRQMLTQCLDLCPPGCVILDAPCGTGKYWEMIQASGRTIYGIDQSGGMLANARARFPDVPTEQRGLQDIAWQAAYPGIICVDAMENIAPEDWPLVLANFARALTPGGHLYLTVELDSAEHIHAAYDAGLALGLPVVEGESAHEGGYHYYPSIPQVHDWLTAAGFTVLAEAEGDDYHHLIAQCGG
jgi:cyclopropane fatty-acyl-phospholipid synthase-like methyltransferase